ncbi:hypothetical protein BAZMOX_01012_2 [methanotrophic endosymbiont of Bathymodiolus azoricus (Menez Gwen)]|nr:hypothetical protein BAZMOX_01012_2 [methanotrophic endosymbiont of Bathymodiolus azoricus (Menez Gwen)]
MIGQIKIDHNIRVLVVCQVSPRCTMILHAALLSLCSV